MGRTRRIAKTRAGVPHPWMDVDLEGAGDTREQILRTAYALFWRHGINAVGVDRIVSEAGVAKTSLYRHFGSKEGLVVAVIERHTDVWTRNWLQSEIERRGKTPAKQLIAIFDAFDDWFHEEPFEGCLFINTLTESHHYPTPVRDAALAALAEIRALIAEVARAAGVRDTKTFAQRLQILMMGSITNALQGNVDAARDAQSIAEVFLQRELREA